MQAPPDRTSSGGQTDQTRESDDPETLAFLFRRLTGTIRNTALDRTGGLLHAIIIQRRRVRVRSIRSRASGPLLPGGDGSLLQESRRNFGDFSISL